MTERLSLTQQQCLGLLILYSVNVGGVVILVFILMSEAKFCIFPVQYHLAIGLSYVTFIMLRCIPAMPTLLWFLL